MGVTRLATGGKRRTKDANMQIRVAESRSALHFASNRFTSG